jgi:tetratricopeptide (TPR) repeat protein
MNQKFHMPKVPLVGIHQIGFDGAETSKEIESRTTQMIARSLNVRSTIAFVGSGISSAYGHDNWDKYAKELVTYTLGQLSEKIREEHVKTLAAYVASKELKNGKSNLLRRSDQTLLILDLCDELFAAQGVDEYEKFRKYTAGLIDSYKQYESTKDPLGLIIEKLDIRRFLTTNYDCQIEDALKRILGCKIVSNHKAWTDEKDEDYGAVKPIARSLIHQSGNVEDLTQFAVAAPGYEMGVFHLHGVCGDRDSMVITERDYQRVYLQEDRDHRAFRDALQVGFAGNAILFLGMGMEEADLLRPLRQFVSEATRGGYERPLFALLPNKYPEEADEFRQYLYSRYNVKTLFYAVKENETDYTESFCTAIDDLGRCWSQWWQGWQEKPAVRKPKFFSPVTNCVIRHLTEPELPFDVAKDTKGVSDAFANGAGAVLVLGRQGLGKGTLGQRIVNETNKTNDNELFDKRFFATAHFSNDFLCIIDAAADFFGEHDPHLDADEGPSSLERFEKALNSARNLFVIGGLERLLVPTSLKRTINIERSEAFEYPLLVGEALTQEIKQFFVLVSQQGTRANKDPRAYPGRIVLTSSVWPESLDISGIATVWLDGVSETTILGKPEFFSLQDDKLVRELHRVLRGHAYALAVIRSALALLQAGRVDGVSPHAWLNQLIDRLTPVDLDGRGPKAIAIATKIILGSARPEIKDHLDSILQRVALFSTPVTPLAVQACYPGAKKPPLRVVEEALEYLQDCNLLIRVQYEYKPFRTTAHTLVRNLVLKRMGSFPTAPGEAHRFEVGGWSSEVPDTFSGAGEGHKLIIDSIDSSLSHLEQADKTVDPQRRDLIRAVFGLIRSRCTATAIPRLSVLDPEPTFRMPRPHYDAYQRRLSQLLNAIRTTEGVKRWRAPNAERGTIEHVPGALYADELAWLYNELGLVAFSTGFMPDAYALFRAGQHVNAVAERGLQGYRWCESEINLGLVQMERGHLVRARYHFENAVRASAKLDVGTLVARAVGHLGLIHHLTGNYRRSKELYDSAVEELLAAGNRRGASIFLKHRGDLLRRMGKFKEAAEDLQGSVAAAESGSHPDLVHYAMIARANLARAENKLVPIEELVPAIDFARRVGIPKLEWDAKIVQGQIALDQGEFEMAGRLAVSTLGIASSLGLRLRLTGSLILLGRVTDARGHSGGARKLFHSAIQLAERQGNQLLIEKAAEALRASHSTTRHSLLWKSLTRQPVSY